MKREYWIILIAYIAMQLSSFIGVPITSLVLEMIGFDTHSQGFAGVTWLVISFSITLVIVLLLLRNEMVHANEVRNGASIGRSILWSITGVFLALFAQAIAANIERLIGIEVGSDNTQQILRIIETFPIMIVVSSVIGPILEEIVFRKIIFGAFYKRFNFFLSALLSSVIFSFAHMEPEHTLLYSAMGFTFAYLYVKTNRILVPIVAHVSMNTFVVLVQSIYREDLEKLIKQAEQMQSFIGGFFL
ncbi:CPBP family intramembrane metalloprotease [Robertmurraya korlensis]|uniref:CPBP family intramembrane glutamic endopeptidase n=1 Tax=Robertmurraya korlensis TaxID=519977 RepID=UPI00203DB465|nr:CPBP family intramembrane glutamic endopeptidase [Robertmurraya korlensis]MCM3603350.1 CPBP family intramembrane metalloprotease [Robertmurraya korlensis]